MKKIIIVILVVGSLLFAGSSFAVNWGNEEVSMLEWCQRYYAGQPEQHLYWFCFQEYMSNYKILDLPRIESDIEMLKKENAELRAEINQLKSQSVSKITKKYYRHFDSQDVFETGTDRHIGYDEAVAKNIWGDVQIIY